MTTRPQRFTMPKTARSIATLAVALACTAFGSCRTVEFWEMERFGDPVMAFDENPAEVHFHQKVFYSMEGSAGGIGTSAGGGCGCY